MLLNKHQNVYTLLSNYFFLQLASRCLKSAQIMRMPFFMRLWKVSLISFSFHFHPKKPINLFYLIHQCAIKSPFKKFLWKPFDARLVFWDTTIHILPLHPLSNDKKFEYFFYPFLVNYLYHVRIVLYFLCPTYRESCFKKIYNKKFCFHVFVANTFFYTSIIIMEIYALKKQFSKIFTPWIFLQKISVVHLSKSCGSKRLFNPRPILLIWNLQNKIK